MTDVHTKEQRSYNMSRIRSKNTKPELAVRSYLHRNGFRYRLHDRKLPGKPDIILPKYRTVIFIHGCFWHAHKNCKYFKMPETRTEWWRHKLMTNQKNYEKAKRRLRKENWCVITIWECRLKEDKKDSTLSSLIKKIIE